MSIQCTPFTALYGRDPPSLIKCEKGSTNVANLEDSLLERDAVLDNIKAHLLRAQQRMKTQEDAKWRELVLEVGDMVYLKLQPYWQKSLSHRLFCKLAARFYEPYEVLEKIGSMAYKLLLPPTARIHNVFHVSQLKKALVLLNLLLLSHLT